MSRVAANNPAPASPAPPGAPGAHAANPSQPGAPIATIVISTRNRKDELRRTLASCLTLDAGSGWIETIVVDDDSTDGTRDMIAAEFPSVRVIHKPKATGYIVSRNMGAREARGPIIFSIDDDAVFTSTDTVLRTLAEFNHPRIGAIAMPHIHITDGPREYDRAPGESSVFIGATYVGTAHALRRDIFLALGGYQEALVHQGEESEYCLRMLDAGYIVALGRTPPIHHFPSKVRNLQRQLYLGARNSILNSWINVPTILLPVRLAANVAKGCMNALRLHHPRSFVSGVFAGLFSIPRWWSLRQPVSMNTFRLARIATRTGSIPFSQAESLLNPPRSIPAPVTA
jgi:GT2 family glycosyltransferase